MSKKLFVRQAAAPTETQGPYGLNELRSLAASGQLQQSDQVSQDGKKWFPATKIRPSLFPEPAVPESAGSGDNDIFNSLPDFETPTAPVSKPAAIPKFPNPPARPKPKPAPKEPVSVQPDRASTAAPIVLMVGGGAAVILLLGLVMLLLSFGVSGLTAAREKEFATNSSEPRTTSEWIAFLRSTYGRKSIIRDQASRQEAGKAANFVDFDPAATEVLFDALADEEYRISGFAETVLRKASDEMVPDKTVVYEQLSMPNPKVRRIAAYVLATIPGGVQENVDKLESILASDEDKKDERLRAYVLACLGTLEGGAKKYLPEYQKLDRSGRAQTLFALTDHQQGHNALAWYAPEHNSGFETAGLVLRLEQVPKTTKDTFALGALDRNAGSHDPGKKIRDWFADRDADVADELFARLKHEDRDVQFCAACALHTIANKLPASDATRLVDHLDEFSRVAAQSELLLALSEMGEKAKPEAGRLAKMLPDLSYQEDACTMLGNIGVETLPPGDLVQLLSDLMDLVARRAPQPHFGLGGFTELSDKTSAALVKQSLDNTTLLTLNGKVAGWKRLVESWEQAAKSAQIGGRSTSVKVFNKGVYDADASARKQDEYLEYVRQYQQASQIVNEAIENLQPVLSTASS